jgi:hypothetical protein
LLSLVAGLPAQRFLSDDPLDREPRPRDASQAVARKISDYYDFFLQSFGAPGEPSRTPANTIPAQSVNTLGEPMDGAWYVKRHYYRPMTVDQLVSSRIRARASLLDSSFSTPGSDGTS